MKAPEVESTDRQPADVMFLGMTAGGALFAIAGVLTTTVWAAVLGLVGICFGAVYFLLTEF